MTGRTTSSAWTVVSPIATPTPSACIAVPAWLRTRDWFPGWKRPIMYCVGDSNSSKGRTNINPSPAILCWKALAFFSWVPCSAVSAPISWAWQWPKDPSPMPWSPFSSFSMVFLPSRHFCSKNNPFFWFHHLIDSLVLIQLLCAWKPGILPSPLLKPVLRM